MLFFHPSSAWLFSRCYTAAPGFSRVATLFTLPAPGFPFLASRCNSFTLPAPGFSFLFAGRARCKSFHSSCAWLSCKRFSSLRLAFLLRVAIHPSRKARAGRFTLPRLAFLASRCNSPFLAWLSLLRVAIQTSSLRLAFLASRCNSNSLAAPGFPFLSVCCKSFYSLRLAWLSFTLLGLFYLLPPFLVIIHPIAISNPEGKQPAQHIYSREPACSKREPTPSLGWLGVGLGVCQLRPVQGRLPPKAILAAVPGLPSSSAVHLKWRRLEVGAIP